MAVTLHSNNALGYLATPVAPGDTTVVLQLGQGARFPAISTGEQFYVTVENRAVVGAMEIMLVTAKAVDSFTVLRGQQGTTAQSFAAGTSVANRVTAAFLNDFDTRIASAGDTADAAAVAAATALAAATAANSGLALKANIANPALTGVPTAPTASPGTATNQLATTAFVAAAVGAGGGGGGAPLDSPAFTGVPTAPTAAPGTSTTQLATTAFVAAAVTQGVTGLAPLASPAFTGAPTAPTAADGSNTTQVATTAFVASGLALKANVTNPTFLGTPAAPTATAGTNTTQIATTAFVATAVAAGGGGGGGAPDPAIWATLASPAFTGIPTAPTALSGTNTTQLATTAFVSTAVATLAGVSAPLASPTFTGTPAAPTAAPGTSTTQVATTAFVTAGLNLKADLASPSFSGIPAAPTASPGTSTTQLATTAFVTTALAVGDPTKAPLASPALTGTPTAPTAGQGASNTQIATTAFVTIGLATKVGSASPALTGVPTAPTATAGTSTTQIATTSFVTTALAAKADLASPTFTGIPSAPTAAPGTSNTQLATTAFAVAELGSKVAKAGDTMSGLLQFSGTTHTGLRFNLLTTTQRNGIGGLQAGMASFNLTTGHFEGYNGTSWNDFDRTPSSGQFMVFPTPSTAPSDGDILVASMPSSNAGEFQVRSIPTVSALTSPNTAYGITPGGTPVTRSPAEQAAWELQAATLADSTIGIDVAGGPYVQRTLAAQAAKLLPYFVGSIGYEFDAKSIRPQDTNGCGDLVEDEFGTNLIMRAFLPFSPDVDTFAQCSFILPEAFNPAGSVKAKFFWSHGATSTNYGTVWSVAARAWPNDGAADSAWGGAQTIADTGGNTSRPYATDLTTDITIAASTLLGGQLCRFKVGRLGTNASDNMTVVANLHKVKIYIPMLSLKDL